MNMSRSFISALAYLIVLVASPGFAQVQAEPFSAPYLSPPYHFGPLTIEPHIAYTTTLSVGVVREL